MLSETGIRSLNTNRFGLNAGKLGYVTPTNGDPTFREQLARDRYGRSKEEILFTCGTQEANFLTFFALLSRSDHAIVVTPTYQALHSIPDTLCDVSRICLKPPQWKLDLEEVKEAVQDNTSLIVVVNPNNPTGRYHACKKIKALYDLVEDLDAYLLCDEVYRLLTDDPLDPVTTLGEHGISTSSVTKSYGLAGLRFGWVAGPQEVIEKAWKWKDYTTISPPLISQHIAKQVLGNKEEEILQENRSLARKNREIVHSFVKDHSLEWHYPVGVLGFITIPDYFDNSREFCKRFVEEQRVLLAPGSVFGYDQYFRIGFGLPTTELKEGLSRLSTFLKSSKP